MPGTGYKKYCIFKELRDGQYWQDRIDSKSMYRFPRLAVMFFLVSFIKPYKL